MKHPVWPAVLVATCLGAIRSFPALPDIVVILADDLGYGDVRALNPDGNIPTPHLDRLAAEGMVFTASTR